MSTTYLHASPNKLATTTEQIEVESSDITRVNDQEKAIQSCINILNETGLVNAKESFLRRYCETLQFGKDRKLGRLGKRIMAERATELNPFVITPHEASYAMPIMITDNFNQTPYEVYDIPTTDNGGDITDKGGRAFSEKMENIEAKYQMSFKVPLNTGSLFVRGDGLYFGMTLQAWWQIYASELSSPFRETNYKPEVFYIAPLPWRVAGGGLGFAVSLEHQSNGQFQGLSRSWNRTHFTLFYDSEAWTGALKIWHRLEEDEKEDAFDPEGDDNPDITDYLGNYSLMLGYAVNDEHKLHSKIRKNWRTGNGSIELNYTFPFPGKLRGFVQYFSGYGESLIDYNHKQQKIGIGITLTDMF